MSEKPASNIEVRVNVAEISRVKPGTDFQEGLTWEELRQYTDLFWDLQRREVMAYITAAQSLEKEYLEGINKHLPDSFTAVCAAHEAFLLPETVVEQSGEEVETEGESDSMDSGSVEIIERVTSQGVPDPQAEVYLSAHDSKHFVLAPPGTGKTYTVLKRLGYLRQHFEGDLTPVLGVTYSRAASAELQQRLVDGLGSSSEQGFEQLPNLRTLDSFSGTVLANIGEGLLDEDYDASIRKLAEILEGKHGKEARSSAGAFIRQQVAVVIVDEVQDVVGVRARLLFAVLSLFRKRSLGLLLLGDLRQSINGFQLLPKFCSREEERRLTSFRLVRQIQELYGDISKVEFDKTYRFNHSIAELMTDLRGAMDDPTGKALPGEEPDRIRLREIFEVVPELESPMELAGDITEGKRTAILARTNAQVKKLEVACTELLGGFGRKVRVVSGSSSESVARFPGWIGRIVGHRDAPTHYNEDSFLEDYEAYVDLSSRREARERLEFLWSFLKFEPGSFSRDSIVRAMALSDSVPSDLREKPAENEVWISTIHQAKGREFDVVVVSDPLGILGKNNDSEKEAEECRLAYVAATRAKKELYRCGGGRNWHPSVFPFEISHFDLDAMAERNAKGEADWYRLQDELWRCSRELGNLRLLSPDGKRFVLAVQGSEVQGSWPVWFSDEFTGDFIGYARNVMNVTDPFAGSYMVKIIHLNTVVSGADNRVLLVPDLSGKIVRS